MGACWFVQQTRESWQVVFFISAGISALGGVLFCVLGSGVIQPWARQQLRPTEDFTLVEAAADRRAPVHTD